MAAGTQIVMPSSMPSRTGGLVRELGRRGFPLVEAGPFTNNTRVMLNRGLNGGSNFFILVETAGNRLRVFMMDPDETREAANMPYGKMVLSFTEGKFSRERFAKFVDRVAKAAMELSAKKPNNTYFYQMHFHLGSIGDTLLNTENGMLDDGVSSFTACAINAAFTHTDGFVHTMHNNFKPELFERMQKTLWAAGIIAIPGREATLPIYNREPWLEGVYNTEANPNPNGPHTLILADSAWTQAQIGRAHFSNSKYQYAPSSHAHDDMERVLSEIKNRHGERAAIIFAHPTCDSNLPQVGLLDRVFYGEISVRVAEDLVQKYAQGIACFNAALDPHDVLDFEKIREKIEGTFGKNGQFQYKKRMLNMRDAEGYVKYLLDKWGAHYGRVPSRNTLNLAFAAEMGEKFGTAKIYESDAHNHNRLYARLFGGRMVHWIRQMNDFGKGHVRLWLPPEENRKLSAREFVSLLHRLKNGEEKDAKLGAVVHSIMQEGVPMIAPERERVTLPQKLFDVAEKMYYYIAKQGIVLADDTWKAILRKIKKEPMLEVNDHDVMVMNRGSAWWPK